MNINDKSKWTLFWDMHSGGGQKTKWSKIYINAPEKEAIDIFVREFNQHPHDVACECCGTNFAVSEHDSLSEASGYHRNAKYVDGEYIEEPDLTYGRRASDYDTLEQYISRDDVKIIEH